MAKGEPSSEFEAFLQQERADADEKANIGRLDKSTPVERAIAFIDAVQGEVQGRESAIGTMKGGLRFFDWNRRTPERIWLRASDYEMVLDVADDEGNVGVKLKRYPREAGKRAEHQLVDVPGWDRLIDVSKLGLPAIRHSATELLINFLRLAYP